VLWIGILWLVNFIREKTNFICMVSVATYYFSSNRQAEGSANVMKGFNLAYTKHAGSLALGALVHVIIQMIRNAAEKSSENRRGGGGAVAAVIAVCVMCFMRFLEEWINIVDRTALAYMAISGEAYCKSAWNGFLLLMKHLFSFYFARTVGAQLVFIGVVMITAINSLFFYLILSGTGVM
jgi:hypothetical protein